MSSLHHTYAEREKEFSSQLARINKRINIVSNLRLLVAVVIIVSVYFAFSNQWILLGTAALIAIFTYLVRLHGELFPEKVHLQNLVRINKEEESALKGEYSFFEDGSAFIDPHHPYTHDLDIFGPGSLYQYINRCHTIEGRKAFADTLRYPELKKDKILRRQEAIKDLSGRIDFRQHIQAAAMETGEQPGDVDQLKAWVQRPPFFKSNAVGWIIRIVPPLTLISLAITFFTPLAKIFLFSFIIAQLLITGSYLKRINAFHEYISRKKNILQNYSRLLLHLEKETFNTSVLSHLSVRAGEADEKISRLAALVGALDARNNSMTTLVVNSLLLYDLQCVWRLEKWRADNATKLNQWLSTISDIEVLNSFATYHSNHSSFQFGEVSDDMSTKAVNLAHPLIPERERVANTVTMGPESNIMIITGANMAGKSTFLRTLGVNLVLAQNGAPVCASSFSFPLASLRSGMRTADSLQDHQSYFYAELNRLKTIMDTLRSGEPLIILLDEILKGTNSNDKQAGSIALVRQLLPFPCLAVIATHDLALGALEQEYPNKVKNYCFEALIENDQLSFDYQLKRGVAEKMNASFLMRKMGIIPA